MPLALAWALTVHKSQGATIDYLCADLDGCFAEGQAYVAVSRASSIQGLEIRNFTTSCVRSSVLVRHFYAAIDSGTHDAFIRGPELWWGEPILMHPSRRWKSFFMRHPIFADWAMRHQRDAATWAHMCKAHSLQCGGGEVDERPGAAGKEAGGVAVGGLQGHGPGHDCVEYDPGRGGDRSNPAGEASSQAASVSTGGRVKAWCVQDVQRFVKGLTREFGDKAAVYAAALAANDVNGEALLLLSEEDLKELGLSLGHRKLLFARVSTFREGFSGGEVITID